MSKLLNGTRVKVVAGTHGLGMTHVGRTGTVTGPWMDCAGTHLAGIDWDYRFRPDGIPDEDYDEDFDSLGLWADEVEVLS